MGELQPGLRTPAATLGNAYRFIMDLRDCFYTVHLHSGDCGMFTFSELACTFEEPLK